MSKSKYTGSYPSAIPDTMLREDAADDPALGCTRRSFLTGTLAGIAATAVAGTAGFAQANEASASNIPTEWDMEYDIVCVGAGTGMAAGIEAARAGASVVVLEKMPHYGGLTTAAGGGGHMGGNNVLQQQEGVVDDDEAWVQDEMLASENRANPDILRALVAEGSNTCDFLLDLGLNLVLSEGGPFPGSYSRRFNAVAGEGYPGHGGLAVSSVLAQGLEAAGVQILKNHRLVELYREPHGPVVGCRVETPEGTVYIKANKGIVLSTGGWPASQFLLDKYDRRAMGEDTSCTGYVKALDYYIVENTGDGHVAAQNVGAILENMSGGTFYNILLGCDQYYNWGPLPIDYEHQNETENLKKGLTRNADTFARCILVNQYGKRYIDESCATEKGHIAGDMPENEDLLYNQKFLTMGKDRSIWIVTDSAGVEDLEWPLDELNNPDPLNGICLSPQYIAIADTIEELAGKMGIDATGLTETVASYNTYVETGEDVEFHKQLMTGTIEKAPFYAARLILVRSDNRNGIRVNTKMQVIDSWDATTFGEGHDCPSIDDEPVIPHLYASGQTADIFPYRRLHWSLYLYIMSARIAGMNVAKEASL